jgi:DNA-binding NtrC family response regulator
MTELFNLLIAEDDRILASSIKLMVPSGYKVYIAHSPDHIPEHVFFHAALVDMHLLSKVGERPDGPDIIAKIIKKNPQTEIISMSGDLNRENMEAAIKAGAQRFLSKPLSTEEVTLGLDKILAYWQLRKFEFSSSKNLQLIGKSNETEKLRKKIAALKNETSAVLIEGETGTGKEVVARILNQQEGQRPFVTINCAAVNENLFESEFFGHVKGSFTGADTNKIGLAEAAHGGDLFLDEIEALPLSQQAKLLRFLESGEVRKVGAKESITVQTRIIAASNQPLLQLIAEKKFREDLYFRLSSQKIEIRPLRDRTDDISDIANYFIDLEKPRRNKKIETEAYIALNAYAWPGNVRELKRVCEQLALTSPLPMIRKVDVENFLRHTSGSDSQNLNTQEFDEYNLSFEDFMMTQEKKILMHVLKNLSDVDAAAQKLKISKSNLYKKIKDHGITYE